MPPISNVITIVIVSKVIISIVILSTIKLYRVVIISVLQRACVLYTGNHVKASSTFMG